MEISIGSTLQVKGYGAPIRVRVRYGARGGGLVERVVRVEGDAVAAVPLTPVDEVRFVIGDVGEKVYEIRDYGIYRLTFLEKHIVRQRFFVLAKDGFRFLAQPEELLVDELARSVLEQS